MNKVIYNGVDLTTLGLYVSGDKAFSSPEKDYEKVSIPGRSGDLFFWNGKYKNVDVEYDAILLPTPLYGSGTYEEKFRANARTIKETLLSPEGYVRIEDDYNPEEFRLGVFAGPMDIDAIFLQAGKSKLKFDCRPERFLKTQAQYKTGNIGENGVFTVGNPTNFPAKPIFAFHTLATDTTLTVTIRKGSTYNTGDIISEFEVENDNTDRDYVIIDCENEDCYLSSFPISDISSVTPIWRGDDIVNWNSHITIEEGYDFPVLPAGDVNVKITRNGATEYSSALSYGIFFGWYAL